LPLKKSDFYSAILANVEKTADLCKNHFGGLKVIDRSAIEYYGEMTRRGVHLPAARGLSVYNRDNSRFTAPQLINPESALRRNTSHVDMAEWEAV
jgi:hypothetical protein